MRKTLALATVAMLALANSAFAQEAGSPGAVGTEGGLTGSNPPGSAKSQMKDGQAVDSDAPMTEGRSAAPDASTASDPAPNTVRGDQNGQSESK